MVNKRLNPEIIELQKLVSALSSRVWCLENPPKFNAGDMAEYQYCGYCGMYFSEETKSEIVEVVGTNPTPVENYREYYVRFDDKSVLSVSENCLTPIKK